MRSCRWALLCDILQDRERCANKDGVYLFAVSRYCSYQVFLAVARVLPRRKRTVGAVFPIRGSGIEMAKSIERIGPKREYLREAVAHFLMKTHINLDPVPSQMKSITVVL